MKIVGVSESYRHHEAQPFGSQPVDARRCGSPQHPASVAARLTPRKVVPKLGFWVVIFDLLINSAQTPDPLNLNES
jgi:hypothetical protein